MMNMWDYFHSPRIVIDNNFIDMGYIPDGYKKTYSVIIENSGTTQLVIKSIQTGCGCTSVQLDKTIIKPDSSAILNITQESSVLKGDGINDIFIYSNDSQNPVQRIQISYKVSTLPFLSPPQFDFGVVKKESLPAFVVSKIIKMGEHDDFTTLNRVGILPPFLHSRISVLQDSENHCYEITVSLDKDSPVGDIYYPIQLCLDNGMSFSTYISGSVRGELYALPQILDYKVKNNTQDTPLKNFVIRSRSDQKLVLKNVTISESIKEFIGVNVQSCNSELSLIAELFRNKIPGIMKNTRIFGYIIISCEISENNIIDVSVPVRVDATILHN